MEKEEFALRTYNRAAADAGSRQEKCATTKNKKRSTADVPRTAVCHRMCVP
jgi:hypothetical protein